MIFSTNFSCFRKVNIFKPRFYCISVKNPVNRTWNLIKSDITNKRNVIYPEHADIVIIGGGFIGASIGYWLKTRAGSGLSVVILEKDVSYAQTQHNISLGTLTQHFSLPENILLAEHAADFLRNIKTNLNSNVNIQYCPNGFLVLASEKYADRLEQNVAMQKEYGIKNELLTAVNVKEKYPWINTHDIVLGCISKESEGVFNSWELLKGLVMKCVELEVNIVNAEVIGFHMERQRDVLMEGVSPGEYKKINNVIYKTNDNEEHEIKFAACIIAAGDNSCEVAKLAQIGLGNNLLKIPLPVERREYSIYNIEGENVKSSLNTPIIMDTSGVWLRKNGLENRFLCGSTPLWNNSAQELLGDNYFSDIILPSLLNRYSNIKKEQIQKLKVEAHDFNTYDECGILGPHPYHTNLVLAAGFGKLGCQNAFGIGRAVAELIIDGHYSSIDLTRLGFDRMLVNEPLFETNMY